MKKKPYSDKLKAVLSGSLPLEAVHGKIITSGLEAARINGDEEMIRTLEALHKKKAEMSRARTKADHAEDQKRIYSSLQGKTVGRYDVYTTRQLRVITGEVPYEDAEERDYRKIADMARSVEDYALAEVMEDLAREKHADSNPWIRSEQRKKYYETKGIEIPIDPTERDYLKDYELALINSESDPFEYTLQSLKNILDVVERIGSDEQIKIMRALVAEREDPSVVYADISKEEAFEFLQKHAWFPIKRPEEWVKDDSEDNDEVVSEYDAFGYEDDEDFEDYDE